MDRGGPISELPGFEDQQSIKVPSLHTSARGRKAGIALESYPARLEAEWAASDVWNQFLLRTLPLKFLVLSYSPSGPPPRAAARGPDTSHLCGTKTYPSCVAFILGPIFCSPW